MVLVVVGNAFGVVIGNAARGTGGTGAVLFEYQKLICSRVLRRNQGCLDVYLPLVMDDDLEVEEFVVD